MFLAPVLYAVHAVLTGLSMVIMNLLDVKLGFGFSAGLFDYVLNFNKATRPLMLVPVGLVYGAIYYGVFRWVIVRFDLKTPGREPDDAIAAPVAASAGGRGEDFLIALGGAANLVSVDACTTRLRLVVTGQGAVDEPRLKALGARGIVRPSERGAAGCSRPRRRSGGQRDPRGHGRGFRLVQRRPWRLSPRRSWSVIAPRPNASSRLWAARATSRA